MTDSFLVRAWSRERGRYVVVADCDSFGLALAAASHYHVSCEVQSPTGERTPIHAVDRLLGDCAVPGPGVRDPDHDRRVSTRYLD